MEVGCSCTAGLMAGCKLGEEAALGGLLREPESNTVVAKKSQLPTITGFDNCGRKWLHKCAEIGQKGPIIIKHDIHGPNCPEKVCCDYRVTTISSQGACRQV